jgi:hypothetical protein
MLFLVMGNPVTLLEVAVHIVAETVNQPYCTISTTSSWGVTHDGLNT